jgi:hypothetical protein
VSGYSTEGGIISGNVGTPVEIRWRGPEDASYVSNEVQPAYSDCSFSFGFVLKNVQQLGTWEVSAVYPPGDGGGQVIGKTQFEVVPAEEAGCQEPPVREITTRRTTYNLGEDVIVSGLFSASPRDRENNTPVEVRYKGPEDASYVSKKVQPKYSSYGGCRYLQFEFVIKNVQQVGLWDVFAIYRPLKIDLHTQFIVHSGQGIPRCEDIGSPGNGNADDDYCSDDQNKPDGPIDTWIFQITAPEERGSQSIHYGGTIRSSTVDLNIESWASSGGGVSHVELKIDNGKYKRLAPPDGENNNGYSYSGRTIKGLSDGTHTIYARTVDKAGNVDPTPAHWKFTVNKQAGRDHPSETWINSVRDPAGKNIPNGGSTSSKVVTVDFQSTATDTGKGSHVDLKIDNGRYKAVASPKTITDLSVGKHTIYLKGVDKYGNEEPTPAKWTFTVIKGKGGFPETWINWVRATPKGVNIADGGSTPSSTVIVDFQGTVSGRGSHIDLKIDNGPYEPVASRHKITDLSVGKHTIYLKAINQKGQEDPTPAKWTFTVGEEDDEQPPQPPPVVCPAILEAGVETDKAVYHPGDTVKISGMHGSWSDRVGAEGLVKLEWNNSNAITRATATVVSRHDGYCSTHFVHTVTLGEDVQLNIGTWSIRALWGEVEARTTFEVVEKEGWGKPKLDPKQDLDGDGLLNSWEQDGIDVNQDGRVDLNLATLGADPYHKDVFLEIDYIEHHKPFDESISKLISIFADSPTQNPDGKTGISLHVELGDEIPHKDIISWDEESSIRANYLGSAEQRSDANNENIITAKQAVYHYALFVHHTLDEEGNPKAGAWGCQYPNCKNILIAFGDPAWGTDPSSDHPNGSKYIQTAVLLHELGHNFGLYHGGFEVEKDVDNKANYLSLMHALFLYAVPLLDYSGCELLPLDENNLNEQEGVGTSCPPGRLTGYFHEGAFYTTQTGVPIDWNGDGDLNDTGVIADINNDMKLTILHGHDDWSKLKFGKFITASTASSFEQLQQNQTMAAESLEFKKPDHFHDFLNEARESHKMQMDAIEHAIESFTNQSSTNRTTTIDDEEQRVIEANMLMEDVHEARSLVESDRLDNVTARLEVIREKVSAWNTDSTESESQRRTIISLIDNVIESFEKTGTPAS